MAGKVVQPARTNHFISRPPRFGCMSVWLTLPLLLAALIGLGDDSVGGHSLGAFKIVLAEAASADSDPLDERETMEDRHGEGRLLAVSSVTLWTNAHNTYRANLGLPLLKWDAGVQASAKAHASTLEQTCTMEHGSTTYGENLFMYSSTVSSPSLMAPSYVVGKWASESQYYNYATNVCQAGQVCGHYTQIVWRQTTLLGCASVRCTSGGWYHQIFVCRYSPAGNVVGQKPY